MKKLISSLLVIIVLITTLITAMPVISNASYENTWQNTGDQRNDIVGVALTQIGYREGSNNDTKYGDWYNLPNQPWCAMFISWCARQANIPTNILKNSAVASPNYSYFDIPYYSGSSYTPKPGDLFFTTSFSHVGLVYYVDGDYFYTIEGNSNDSGDSEGIGVFSLRRKTSAFYFGVPEYTKSYSTIPDPVLTLRSDKKVYNSGESIHFEWEPSYGAEEYWVYLWKDGVQLFSHNCGSNTSFTQAPSTSGKYTLIIRPGNLNGFNDSSPSCSFVVTNDVPEPVTTLVCDKEVYDTSESIHFEWEPSYGAEEYWVYLWKDGVQLFSHNCGSNTSFTQAPSTSGKYTLIIRPGNSNGFNDSSPSCSFVVGKYDVNYNANGGSGAPLSQTKVYGSTLTLSNIIPVRTGYTFTGWNTKPDGSGILYSVGASYKDNADVILYAQWDVVHNHNYTSVVSQPSTCTNEGIITYSCLCGDIYNETIPALGHTIGESVETQAPTCIAEGTKITYCSVCREAVLIENISMLDHNWSEWIQISAPTATEDGEQLRYCKTCKTSETEVIPALGEEPTPDPEPEPEDPVDPNAPAVVSVNNYTISLDKITNIKEIRFAIGHYTKGADIKAAEKNVTLDTSTVAKYTVDGIMTYDLPWMGEYTFWVRYNDGSQYFIYTDVDEITPYVESYGVKLTVKDYAENYKDMWLAEGTFNSYSEIKASTAFKYQASANKLDLYAKTTHDFSYTMTNPGAYTVLIRYNDGTTDVIHTELTVDVPEFSVNGLQTTVQNIPDIKIIRTAYGHYESVGDIKKASGVRNFSNKNDIKNAEEYMIQYREAGEVTLIVEYNNGYKHFYYHNIQPKSATMIQSKNTVMFDDLDGIVMIRYAKGTYTTSSQIKAAEGSKVIKPADLVGGYAIISNLEAGTYTFCVQFDDESYDYYTITVE